MLNYRAELMVLEFKREQCRKGLEEETEQRLGKIRENEDETDALGMSTDEVCVKVKHCNCSLDCSIIYESSINTGK